MDEFVVIKVMNEATLRALKEKNGDYSKNKKIKEILEDEACFFKMSKEAAFSVLFYSGVNTDKLEETYKKVIAKDRFDRLVTAGKINIDDEKLIIKYI